MKNFIAALMLTTFTMSAFAANQVTLQLSGEVPELVDISIDTTSAELDLENGESDTLVATVTERSNVAGGYEVSVVSSYASNLQLGADTTKRISYQLYYEDTLVTGGSRTFPYTGTTPSGGVPKTVKVTLPVQDLAALESGIYNDTVTFTISAN